MPETVGQMTVDLVGVMPRCRDCRFWTDDLGLPNAGNWISVTDSVTRYCLVTREGSHFGVHGPENPLPSTLAYAHDDEGYRAVLVTDAHFGCVQFQSRGATS